MVFISEGPAIIGNDEEEVPEFVQEAGDWWEKQFKDNTPARKVSLKGFSIDKYEVRNSEYKLFCEKTGHPEPASWEDRIFPEGKEDNPVSNISWHSADRYCKWLGKRLPTEEEWEKAARGPAGNLFPWGSEFDSNKANFSTGKLLSVGMKQEDKSHYGVYDMAGNVREWTSSWYEPYPGSKHRFDDMGKKHKVMRGGEGLLKGHYTLIGITLRVYIRRHADPNREGTNLGFRCAKNEEP